MKIIGQSMDTCIVECSHDELANLIGYYWIGSSDCPKLKPGMEINIHAMYKQLTKMKEMGKQCEQVKDNLKFMINTLQIVEPIIDCIKAEVAP